MKLIKPAEISAKIMTLIDEAEKQLIIVSPYNNITGWSKLINRIKKAQSRGVTISWYSRKNNVDNNNAEEVIRNLGLRPVLIDDLHAKIYMNEESAIFTSMNMSKISDDKSLDLGYITVDKIEYDEIQNFYKKHIKSLANNDKSAVITEEVIKKNVPIKDRIPKINSDENWVIVLYEHIYKNYGAFKFTYEEGSKLEYYDFIKAGYRLVFLKFDNAIKILLYIPETIPAAKIKKGIYENGKRKKLLRQRELNLNDDGDGRFVKYFYENFYKEVDDWGKDNVDDFTKNLDIIIEMIFVD